MIRRILWLATVIVLAAACGQPIVEEVSTTGDISGVVYDKNVGDPISVAQVQLTPGGASTVTGTDGSFAFKNIEAGSYTVTVTKKGYNDASNKVTVSAGKKADCHLLMERIPAYVTADKTELDFGDNLTLTTLSFNIVNSSYENLSWHIDYDKSSSSFITEVTPESGTTQYGKTAVIVVKIDRDKLNAGANESTIVVVSDNGDGSSEVKVKAIGQEKSKATVNVKSVTDITASTAIVNGEITFPGVPSYMKRGFVYATTENPTIDVTIELVEVSVTDETQFSYMLKGLSLGVKYYVRAYAINDVGVAYSNQESFSTVSSLPVVSVSAPDHIDASNKTATLHGSVESVGDPAYFEKGFVYCEGRKTPTIDDRYVHVAGTGLGAYSESISELKLGSTYSVRAYAKNEGGIAYSDKTVEFTLSGSSPVVSVGETTDINLAELSAILHGTLDSVGSPAASEKGFVYSPVNKTPTDSDLKVKASNSDAGSYYVAISQLELGKTYYVRAYAKNEMGIIYSSGTTSFSTEPAAPVVSMLSITNIDLEKGTALFKGTVDSIGDPAFTEKGFVYSSTNNTPSMSDSCVPVVGNGVGTYEATVSGLVLSKTYYVRAYAKNAAGVVYSNEAKTFSTNPNAPHVTMRSVVNVDLTKGMALFQGTIDSEGDPAFTEKGFVYSISNNMPTLNDISIQVEGKEAGAYEAEISGLENDKKYYVRGYAVSVGGTVYSDNAIMFSTELEYAIVETQGASDVNPDSKTAILHGKVIKTGNPPYTEKGFVLSSKYETPTLDDKKIAVVGVGLGDYEYRLNDYSTTQYTYYRAYIVNAKGVTYGNSVLLYTPDYVDMGDYIVLSKHNIAVQKQDGSDNTVTLGNAISACEGSPTGGFSDWRIPSVDELYNLYYLKDIIGGFKNSSYWSNTNTGTFNTYYYKTINFNTGKSGESFWRSNYSGGSLEYNSFRCVRTTK